MMLKIRPFFRWYDLWIGIYIDTNKDALYICPFPTIGIKVEWFKVFQHDPWQVVLISSFWIGKGTYPNDHYPVFRWWHFGPVDVRRLVVEQLPR